jgi:crossover junction endodeoxyribonuclease RusA
VRPPCDRLVVAFELPIRPAPKGRPRFAKGRTYTDARTVAYENAVGLACRAEMTGPPVSGDVEVWAVFEQRDGRRSDIDNLEKSLLDGMQGVAYVNDRQVTRVWKDMRVRADVDRVSVAVLAVPA